MHTIVQFSNSTSAKIVNAGNNKYFTSKRDRKRNLEVQVKNKTKQVDNFYFFETNHKNLYYTNESLRIRERNFLPTDTSETDLRDTKLDQLFVWVFRDMFKNLKKIKLLYSDIEKLEAAVILTTPINANLHQVFLNQQNDLGLHARRRGGVLFVHKCNKVVVCVIENSFRTKEVPVRLSSDNNSERIRYMDPITKILYRYFKLANCNFLYPNALMLHKRRQLELIDKPIDMSNHRVNVNRSNTAPMEGQFNENDLERSKTAQRLRKSSKTKTGREFSWGKRLIWTWEFIVLQHGFQIQAPVARTLRFFLPW